MTVADLYLAVCPKCEKVVDYFSMEFFPNYGLLCPKCVKENEDHLQ